MSEFLGKESARRTRRAHSPAFKARVLTDGYSNLSVLDRSAEALIVARNRLAGKGSNIEWIVGDICNVDLPAQTYDIWHDRAVFHFLTDPADRRAYVEQVMKSVKPGGHVIVATFGPNGPKNAAVFRSNVTRRTACTVNSGRLLN